MTLEEELKIVVEAKTNIQSFGKIYDFYFGKIFVYCINRLMIRELAEDITSSTFLKAAENIYKFDTTQNIRFGSWLYRTANNNIIDLSRRLKHSEFLELIEENHYTDSNMETSIEKEFRRKNIAIVLSKIKPRYQEIISLRFFSELEIEEIGDVIDEKKSNVSVVLHRALNAFKKQYEIDFPEEDTFFLE